VGEYYCLCMINVYFKIHYQNKVTMRFCLCFSFFVDRKGANGITKRNTMELGNIGFSGLKIKRWIHQQFSYLYYLFHFPGILVLGNLSFLLGFFNISNWFHSYWRSADSYSIWFQHLLLCAGNGSRKGRDEEDWECNKPASDFL